MASGRRLQNSFDAVVRALAPYLGENMARAAVQGHREKLGLMASTGSPADLERLLTALGPGLGVFVGREKTATLLLEIRAELDLPGLPR